MTAPSAPDAPASLIDRRYGSGAELLLRVTIIALEGRVDGIGVSELRRLLGYSRDALDRMDDDDFAAMVSRSGPFLGTALMIAREPTLARRHARTLRDALDAARRDLNLPTTFLIGAT